MPDIRKVTSILGGAALVPMSLALSVEWPRR